MLIQLVKIPNRYLGACVLVLSFVGVYSLRNSATDCIIAAVFGVFGFVLKRLSLPIVPIILGMVLGGIMEVKLRAGMARVKTPFDFIDRPIAMILFLMILVVLAMHFRRTWLDHQSAKETSWSTKLSSTHFAAHLSRRRNSLLTARGKARTAKRSPLSRPSTDRD
jgi:putative tricarboxylic transport membrane protein